jgi:hypothetical protein
MFERKRRYSRWLGEVQAALGSGGAHYVVRVGIE